MCSSRRRILGKPLAAGGGPDSRNKKGKRRSLHARKPQRLRIQPKSSDADYFSAGENNAPGGAHPPIYQTTVTRLPDSQNNVWQ